MRGKGARHPSDCSIEALTDSHDLTGFSCGVPPLDSYLRKQARQDVRRGFASVFLGVERPGGEVRGYYSLSMAGVALDRIPEDLRRRMPRHPSVPAVLLGRLAVALEAQRRRLGTRLLVDAIERSFRTDIAWAAIIVDARDEGASTFYRQFGFQPFLDDPLHLFLPRRVVEKLFAER